MATLIQGAEVITAAHTLPQTLDILIKGDRIARVEPHIDPTTAHADTLIDGRNHLITPGLVNAHIHSHDRFDKGRFDTLPLEIWISLYNPPFESRNWSAEQVYLRTLISGIELLKGGTTTVVDDVHHGLPMQPELIDAVFRAYDDLGIRAQVSAAWCDKPWFDGVPYLNEELPQTMRRNRQHSAPDNRWVLECWRELAQRWQERVQFVLSPSAPQRCSDPFLQQTWQLAEEFNRPVNVHVLETKIQALTAQKLYGRSIVEHMHNTGILTPNTMLVHGVWMSEQDLDLIADAGAGIVHNPGCNTKLGSGIAPVNAMLERGIAVGLGTDNHNGNDNANMLEAMKLTSLIHPLREADYTDWVNAAQVLEMATLGGARCTGLDQQIGTIEVGKQADLLMLNTNTLNFLPKNNLLHQLIFCEAGESLERVWVAGKLVMESGKVVSVNEDKMMRLLQDNLPAIGETMDRIQAAGADLRPYLERCYDKCINDPLMAQIHQ